MTLQLPQEYALHTGDGRKRAFCSIGDIPPEMFRLDKNEVHVWKMDISERHTEAEGLFEVLDDAERERASRFHFQQDRSRFVVARGTLRRLLGRYLLRPPQELRFSYGFFGKPSLAPELARERDVRFNVSHSNDQVLLAFSYSREVGIDVERIRPEVNIEEIGSRFFSRKEVKELRALPPSIRREAFFHCWSRKEAFIKAVGKGLSMPLDGFDVSVCPHALFITLDIPDDTRESERWSLVALNPGMGYVAALAVEGPDWFLKSREIVG
jgi:4'-phosphopantetheinyl transferase